MKVIFVLYYNIITYGTRYAAVAKAQNSNFGDGLAMLAPSLDLHFQLAFEFLWGIDIFKSHLSR